MTGERFPSFSYAHRWTCIHLAVHHGYPVRILTAMLDNGRSGGAQRLVDWRTRDLLQETALHMAAKRGDCAATLALIRAGARVNPPDRRRRTPLLVALHGRRDDVARLLVYAGADVNNGRGQPGQTSPLRVAVARENAAMVRFLLERGAVVVDPRTDDLDWTVVHAACESGEPGRGKDDFEVYGVYSIRPCATTRYVPLTLMYSSSP